MYSSKLIETIKVLDQSELDILKQYVTNPIFNNDKQNAILIKFFEYIYLCFPDYKAENFEKEIVFRYLFPDEDFKKSRMDSLTFKLYKIVKTFIKHQYASFVDDELEELLAMARFSRIKQLNKRFSQTIDTLSKKQEGILQKDEAFFFNQFLINTELINFQSLYNRKKSDLNILETLDNLNIFVLVTKLKYACVLFSQSRETTVNFQELINEIERQKHSIEKVVVSTPILDVYYQAYLLLKDEDEEQFIRYNTCLEKHLDEIPIEQIKRLQTLARNFCNELYSKGNIDYLQKGFELYQAHLSAGYLYYENKLTPSTFQSIITLGLRLKVYDWVYDFLHSHKDRIIGTNNTEEVFQYNIAHYHFCIGEHDKALENLAGNYEDIIYTIAARRLEVMIYYTQQSELLDAKIHNFKLFIFRKKSLNERRRLANNNFIDMLIQINSYKTIRNEQRIDKLIDKIESKEIIAEKEWLKEQLKIQKK